MSTGRRMTPPDPLSPKRVLVALCASVVAVAVTGFLTLTRIAPAADAGLPAALYLYMAASVLLALRTFANRPARPGTFPGTSWAPVPMVSGAAALGAIAALPLVTVLPASLTISALPTMTGTGALSVTVALGVLDSYRRPVIHERADS